MLLFFIYAALGVELFGRLGECRPHTRSPKAAWDTVRAVAGPLLPLPFTTQGECDWAHVGASAHTQKCGTTPVTCTRTLPDVHTDTHTYSYPARKAEPHESLNVHTQHTRRPGLHVASGGTNATARSCQLSPRISLSQSGQRAGRDPVCQPSSYRAPLPSLPGSSAHWLLLNTQWLQEPPVDLPVRWAEVVVSLEPTQRGPWDPAADAPGPRPDSQPLAQPHAPGWPHC